MSTRQSRDCIDLISGEKGWIIPTTLRNRIERAGTEIKAAVSIIAETELNAEEIKETLNKVAPDYLFDDPCYVTDPARVDATAESLVFTVYNPKDFENSDETTNISVEGICVKVQKSMIPIPEGQEKKQLNNGYKE
jgi:hypothetical protein